MVPTSVETSSERYRLSWVDVRQVHCRVNRKSWCSRRPGARWVAQVEVDRGLLRPRLHRNHRSRSIGVAGRSRLRLQPATIRIDRFRVPRPRVFAGAKLSSRCRRRGRGGSRRCRCSRSCRSRARVIVEPWVVGARRHRRCPCARRPLPRRLCVDVDDLSENRCIEPPRGRRSLASICRWRVVGGGVFVEARRAPSLWRKLLCRSSGQPRHPSRCRC